MENEENKQIYVHITKRCKKPHILAEKIWWRQSWNLKNIFLWELVLRNYFMKWLFFVIVQVKTLARYCQYQLFSRRPRILEHLSLFLLFVISYVTYKARQNNSDCDIPDIEAVMLPLLSSIFSAILSPNIKKLQPSTKFSSITKKLWFRFCFTVSQTYTEIVSLCSANNI